MSNCTLFELPFFAMCSKESTGMGAKEFSMKIKMGVDFVGTTGVSNACSCGNLLFILPRA